MGHHGEIPVNMHSLQLSGVTKPVLTKLRSRGTSIRSAQAHPRLSKRTIASASGDKVQIIKPINGDPFIGMLETPVTSSPDVANFLSNLPAYRTGVAPLLRGVEVGLAHGFFSPWTIYKIGPFKINRGDS